MANIIPQDSNLSPHTIFNSTDFSSEENCPWVQIGNLFVSVTTTGNKSWKPVVEQEYTSGYRAFTILSGRHGDQYGQAVDVVTGAFKPGVADPTHYAQDLVEAADLRGKLGSLQLEVIDVGVAPYNTVQALRTLAKSKLDARRTVIFAWCFSIFSMLQHPRSQGVHFVPDIVLRSYMMRAVNMSVAALKTEHFLWVPGKKWPTVAAPTLFR